ncbi:MAG TPA: ShlB/FhaC/HecB family hemolysin secretion/activation protein [Caulobacteraceae bacterium]|nr:ShlB/FhaC/HecB family hemolysin secretion/activation protein [Caulobacteraceae bacterium]
MSYGAAFGGRRQPRLDAAQPLLLALMTPALALGFASAVQAQTPAPSAGQVLPFRGDPVPIPEFAPTSCAVAPLTAADASASGPALEAISVSGATVIDEATLAREWAPLVGRPADATTLNRLAERIACLYRERGYLFARAEIAPAEAPGFHRLRLTEGRVARIEIEGGDEKTRDFVRRAFGDVRKGVPLRAADVRRGMTLSRYYGVWSVRPQARQNPSDPDTVDLVLTVAPPRASVYATVANASSKTVGNWSLGTSLTVHGLTPLQEQTTVGVFHSLHGDKQRGVQVSSQALVTKSGLGVRGDLALFQQKPSEQPPNQNTVGTTKLARFEASHPLAAHTGALVLGRVGIEAVNQDTELLDGSQTARDRLRVAYAGVSVAGRRGQVDGWAALTLRQGLEAFGASRKGDAFLSRPDADPQATTLRFDAAAARPIAGGQVRIETKAQWADEPLLEFERFTFGGLEGGRGLDPGALSGDKGVAVTVEAEGRPINFGQSLTFRPYVFVDAGKAWNEGDFGPRDRHAVFAGPGARLSWKERVHLDLAYAHPVTEPRGIPDGLAGPKLLVTLSAGFEFD